jgi:hypothetical protein
LKEDNGHREVADLESRMSADEIIEQLRPPLTMLTVETPTFKADADEIWVEEERLAFFTWLVANPDAGDVVPGSGGCRKVRWTRPGTGKRGGVRVIYFTRLKAGEIWLLLAYAKSVRANIPGQLLKAIREEIEND